MTASPTAAARRADLGGNSEVANSTGQRPTRHLGKPHHWPVAGSDLITAMAFVVLVTLAMWAQHGGPDALNSTSGLLTGIGQLTALYGTLAVLAQLVLMSRAPWLERRYGQDTLAHWHRWVGFATVWLLLGHVVFTTFGFALSDKRSFFAESWHFVNHYADVLMAVVGFAMFLAVAFTSVKRARRKLAYETWFFVHLYAYLAIALTFAHQFAVGTDFADDLVARIWWAFLYSIAIISIFAWRVTTPVKMWHTHRWRIDNVVTETSGVTSLWVTGDRLEDLRAESGQYFVVRVLSLKHWWHGHPFSLSAAPNTKRLRFTIKSLGDHTAEFQGIRPGAKIFLEGPYGALTSTKRAQPKALLIAGGVGITPLRALFEQTPGNPGDVDMMYRVSDERDLVFRSELDRIATARGFTITFLVGRRPARANSDPFHPARLREKYPDIANRDVFICGPVSMMAAVEKSLLECGVPRSQIHSERFDY